MEAIAIAIGCRCRQFGTHLGGVMDTPHVPHPLSKVGIEVAVKDRITGGLVPVTRTAEVDLVGVARTRADALGVEVVRVVVVGVEQPLVVVQVEDVLLLTRVDIPELDEIPSVAVVHIGRIFREQRSGRLDTDIIAIRRTVL